MTRRAAKIDANQTEIVEGLRAVGATVQILSAVGDGCPDILVGYYGVNYPIEIKDGSLPPSQRALTPKQKKWHKEWAGLAFLATSLEDALFIIGGVSGR